MENIINPLVTKIDSNTENIFQKSRQEIDYTFDYEINKIYIENNILYDKITKSKNTNI